MLVYNQSWVKAPSKDLMKQAAPMWNMWKTRQQPFTTLEDAQIILMIASKGRTMNMIMYTSRVRYLVKEEYKSHDHAWKLLSAGIPKKFLKNDDGTSMSRADFMSSPYTIDAAPSGYLMAFLDKPINWIGEPRPNSLILQRNGWGNIPDKNVPKLSKASKTLLSAATEKDELEREILQRKDIGPREKKSLISARRGQGIFKSNVNLYEDRCRVTGTSAKRHLIASHIKPWALSNDEEKIDGFNGFLLAPHIDHLFDDGFISFRDNGDLIISTKLNKAVLVEWGIPVSLNVGKFHAKQRTYLKHHREKTLQK
ncbi:hypothetical protein GALL_386670 [mine drainage metagenome]|uniref:HNH nuclease domain-containing protein n=1 Tax=mine drainage metagenome TaxID=410659 RepID=A0A1J5QI08_9ZZZZ